MCGSGKWTSYIASYMLGKWYPTDITLGLYGFFVFVLILTIKIIMWFYCWKVLRITGSKKSVGIPKAGDKFHAFKFLFFLLVCEVVFLMQVDIFLLCPQWFWKSRLQTFDLLDNANPFLWSVQKGCFSSCSGLLNSAESSCSSVRNHQCDQEIVQDVLVSVSYPGSQIHRVTAEWFWRGRTLM